MDCNALVTAILAAFAAGANVIVGIMKLREAGVRNETFGNLSKALDKHVESSERLIRDYSARFKQAQKQIDRLIELVADK